VNEKRHTCSGVTLIEILIVLSILVVMLLPMIHIYIMSARGMAGAADELEATQLCLCVIEGLQSVPMSELPEDFPEAEVSTLPTQILEKIGWQHPSDYRVVVSLETNHVPTDDTSLDSLAPVASDPRRERLIQQGELRLVRVRCTRLEQGRPGPRDLLMSTVLSRYR